MAHDVDGVARVEALLAHVARVHQHNTTTVVNAAVTISHRIDRGVELVVRANGGEHEMTMRHFKRRDRMHSELRLSAGSSELAVIAKALVTKDIPPLVVAAGIPAKVLRSLRISP